MKSDWPIVTLGDLVEEITVGFVGSMTHEYVDSGIPFFRSKNISEYEIVWDDIRYISEEFHKKIKKSTLRPGDVAIVRTGKPGTTCVIPQSITGANCSDIVIVRVDDEKLSAHYLSYFMNSIAKNQVSSLLVGAVQQHFNVGSAKKIEIPLPSREEQERIVKVLKDLDDKMKLNRQTNQSLEQIAQAIFKSWFVDFEPTRAKINALDNGECPERAAMAAISGKSLAELDQLPTETQQQLKTTAALFPDALVESELGEIPEGWGCSEIGKEVTVVGGGTPSTKNEAFWDGGMFHWTTPKDMSNLNDKVLIGTDRKITEAGLAKISSGLLPVNTVLMSSRAPVGYLAISKIPVAINQGYIAMKCEGALTPEYVVQWTESVMDEIKQRASGTTFAEISKKNFKVIPIVVPSTEVVHEFSKIVSNLYEKMTEALRETKSLTETRDSLLPRLLSGKMELAR